jgi:AcrR family transcriptional regulator
VYRRFAERDQLVHAVLARELRRTLAAVFEAAAGQSGFEDQAVAAVSAALAALDDSVVQSLLVSDPATFLPFLTTGAGPLIDIARITISAQLVAAGLPVSEELAEAAARLGLSYVVTRHTILPLADPEGLDEAIRRMLRPIIGALGWTSGP